MELVRAWPRRIPRSAWLRWLAPLAWAVALGIELWFHGVPAARDRLLVWIVLGLFALSLSDLRAWMRSTLLEWLPFALILAAYDLLRGQADGLLFEAHVRPQLEADRLLFLGEVPTVWLQQHLWHGSGDLRWWDYGAWGVYASYFLATYVVAGWLWFFARERFRRYVATVSLLAFMAFATYTLFPAAPPWMASRRGELEWTTRTVGLVSDHVPVLSFDSLYERGSEYANPVAAVPSLHGAYTLLVAIALWPLVPRWVRPLLAVYPVAMTFALAYTAEHYVVDVLLGWVYVGVALWVVNRVSRRLASRSSARSRATL